MSWRSRGVGVYVASEVHNIAGGRLVKPGAKGVLSLQGSHSVADELFAADLARTLALSDAGFIVAAGDLSQTASQGTFGNDTARTRVGQLRTFAQGSTAPVAAGSGKLHLLGTSGGATAAINYARQNPANVASMYLMVPLLDLQDFYDNRTSPGQAGSAFTKAEIDTAYGGTFAAQVASHSPVAAGNQTALAGIPIRIAYSSNDQYIAPSSVAAFVAAVNAAGGNATSYSLGPVLHNPATVDPADVVGFFQAHP